MSERSLFWLSMLLHVLWWPLGLFSILAAPMALMGFDAPQAARSPLVWAAVLSILSIPVVTLGAEVVAIVLQVCGFPRMTLAVQLAPVVPLGIAAGVLLFR